MWSDWQTSTYSTRITRKIHQFTYLVASQGINKISFNSCENSHIYNFGQKTMVNELRSIQRFIFLWFLHNFWWDTQKRDSYFVFARRKILRNSRVNNSEQHLQKEPVRRFKLPNVSAIFIDLRSILFKFIIIIRLKFIDDVIFTVFLNNCINNAINSYVLYN